MPQAVELPDYPSGGRVAFQTDRDGNSEIYVMGCDGSGQTNLTNNSAEDKQPSWASGGKLAFSSNRNAAGGYDIYLLALSPWAITRVTDDAANDESPALSPDGGKVAFVSYRDDPKGDIYVLDISSESITRITSNAASDLDPAWSHDGTKLAFASDRDGNFDIYKVNADGTGDPAKVTAVSHSTGDDRWPDLGDYYGDEIIAFASDRDGDWEMFFSDYGIDLGLVQITANQDGKIDSNPSWDPLGEYMVIHSNRDGNFDVATMYTDGEEYTNLTSASTDTDSSPDWEPVDDGSYCGE